MGNWEYFELIAFYYRSFLANLQHDRAMEVAIATTFDDYYFQPAENYKVLLLVTSIQHIELQISMLKKVHRQSLDFYNKQLAEVSDELISNHLKVNEMEHLRETITEINYKIKHVEIIKNIA